MSDVNDLPANRLPTDGNRPLVSDDAEDLTANRTNNNGTPSMTNDSTAVGMELSRWRVDFEIP